MPSESQALRKRTTSASTSVTSPSSSTMLGALVAICPLNSARCSARIRPISLIVVLCSPGIVTILKVTVDWQLQSARRSKVLEQIAVDRKHVAVFSEIAEFSAGDPYCRVRYAGRCHGFRRSAVEPTAGLQKRKR